MYLLFLYMKSCLNFIMIFRVFITILPMDSFLQTNMIYIWVQNKVPFSDFPEFSVLNWLTCKRYLSKAPHFVNSRTQNCTIFPTECGDWEGQEERQGLEKMGGW